MRQRAASPQLAQFWTSWSQFLILFTAVHVHRAQHLWNLGKTVHSCLLVDLHLLFLWQFAYISKNLLLREMSKSHHQIKSLSIGSELNILLFTYIEIFYLDPQQLSQLSQKLVRRSLPYFLPTCYDCKKQLKNKLRHIFETVLELLLKSKNSSFSSHHMFHLVPKIPHLSQHRLTEHLLIL